ncbi:MAG: hypothetical protein BWK80_13685 [Desulfobacteraceae bacterium IS3]|nr:MAG: hypothetical protein BWK80_13685 [Desulfobacteraceae bacterium IS3]HAO21631.1 hypothetical protein [Desulfobacteraceae bacterium]
MNKNLICRISILLLGFSVCMLCFNPIPSAQGQEQDADLKKRLKVLEQKVQKQEELINELNQRIQEHEKVINNQAKWLNKHKEDINNHTDSI